MSDTISTEVGGNGSANTVTVVKTTAFEKRYEELKLVKQAARDAQSKLDKIADELVALKAKAAEAEQDLKKARKKVEETKEGLSDLFDAEMRNY